jgi:hypothetical protein
LDPRHARSLEIYCLDVGWQSNSKTDAQVTGPFNADFIATDFAAKIMLGKPLFNGIAAGSPPAAGH